MNFLKILSLSFFLLLSACGADKHSSSLQVGTNLWPGYEPLYIAETLGFLDKKDVRLVTLPSASEVLRSFRNRVIHVAALTLDEALLLAESGVDIAIIQVADVSHGGDAIMVHSEVVSLAQLQGQRIGVESTALGAYVLSRALEINAMQSTDIQLIDLEIGEQEEAFLQKRVDAVVTFDPVKTRLENKGAKVIFDSREIPGEVVDVLVVRRNLIKESPEKIQMLVNAWYQGVDYIQSDPDHAAELSGKHLGISAQEFTTALAGLKIPSRAENRKILADGQLFTTAKKLKQVMLDNRLLNDDFVIAPAFMNSDFL